MQTDGGGSLCPTNAGAHLRFGGLRDAIEALFFIFLVERRPGGFRRISGTGMAGPCSACGFRIGSSLH